MSLVSNLVALLVGFAAGAALGDLVRSLLGGRSSGATLSTLLGLAMLVAVGFTTYTAAEQTACVRDALATRDDAARRSNEAARALTQAQREFLRAVTDPAVPREQRAAAYQQYFAALDTHEAALRDLADARAANPLDTEDCE